jgi:hypothetical protein
MNTVLKTYVAWWVFAASRDGGQEPIGQRIVEVPEDLDQFEAYDSHAKFTAYAPADRRPPRRREVLARTQL